MIKNIVFDVGRVLIDWNPEITMRAVGCTEDDIRLINERIFASGQWNEEDRSVYTKAELSKLFSALVPEVGDKFAAFYERATETAKLRDYACSWVSELCNAGYHIYILSNFGEEAWATAKEMGALDFLPMADGIMVSYMIHEVKPHPAIYEALFNQFKLDPKECVFIDDSEKNIRGSEAVGMRAIHFVTKEQAQKELQEILSEKE